MADPTPVELVGGTSTTATTTANFTARPAGTLLHLSVASDDYRVTTGTNRPESSGWTFLDGREGNLGFYVWYKIADGTETQVSYQIGSATRSAYSLVAIGNLAPSPLGVTAANASAVVTNLVNHTTPPVTPAAGSRWCVVAAVGSTGTSTSGPYAWSGSFAKLVERYHTTGYRPGETVGTVTLDGGTAVSSTVTFASSTGVNQGIAVVSAWKVAAGGGSPGQGSGAGTVALSGSGSGKRSPKAGGSGSVSFSGAGSGTTTRRGSGSGTVSYSGSGNGQTVRRGTGSGTLAWSGSGSGTAPAVDGAGGSGSGVVAYVGAGTGKRTPKASGTGAVAFVGAGSGAAPDVDQQSGTGVGSWAFAGSGAGKRTPIGTGSGAVTFAGTGTGATQRAGSGSGTWAFAGTGIGIDPSGYEDITVAVALAPRRTSALLGERTTAATLAPRRTTATLEDR